MIELKGKVAVVTGSGSGIGLHYATELLNNDLKGVTIVDINEKNGMKALEELQKKFGNDRVIFVKTDITDIKQFEDAFKKTVEKFGHVDILINNAGVLDDRIWEKQISINVNGTINGILLAIQNYICKHKSGAEGVVVNISSVVGLDISTVVPIYGATKHAVTSLSRSFGSDVYYDLSKVRVFCVCPGSVETELMQGWLDKSLKPEYTSELKKMNISTKYQSGTHVAQNMVKLIKDAPNGSVWVIEENTAPYKIDFPGYTESMRF
ncbi:hypothetical protein RN001_009277 [Aquatica leii]|uniref:15-hydroxyprostaglandin dehydrogenase [NAD(+)]-like n=1 Tax=Aquatica leii TaxID=1421715 RepID=A0AAN7P8H3_9COLE|nr:hypothetical protein RN001_009277 [Aquatica leii]